LILVELEITLLLWSVECNIWISYSKLIIVIALLIVVFIAAVHFIFN